MHKVEKMYVPEMIFGTLLTSSNYNDNEGRVTGGRNGFGAKLCNVFSTKFTVETSSKEYKQKFKQVGLLEWHHLLQISPLSDLGQPHDEGGSAHHREEHRGGLHARHVQPGPEVLQDEGAGG